MFFIYKHELRKHTKRAYKLSTFEMRFKLKEKLLHEKFCMSRLLSCHSFSYNKLQKGTADSNNVKGNCIFIATQYHAENYIFLIKKKESTSRDHFQQDMAFGAHPKPTINFGTQKQLKYILCCQLRSFKCIEHATISLNLYCIPRKHI